MKVKRDNTYCCVPQCSTKGDRFPDLSFFHFPPPWRVKKRAEWIRLFRIGKDLSERAVVCSKHFKATDFTQPRMLEKKPRRLKPTAVPSLFLPRTLPEEEEKIKKKKQNEKKQKASVTKSKTVAKTNTSSKKQKSSAVASSFVLNYKETDIDKSSHLLLSNENMYINIAHSSSHSPILEKKIKVEEPWEKEYNFLGNITNENYIWDESNLEEIGSEVSSLSTEDPNNSMQYINTENIFQEKDSPSENVEAEKNIDKNKDEVDNNVFSEKNLKRKNEFSGGWNCFDVKKRQKCKIGRREETFGRFIACEMSDLSGNPVLYLKTKQIILRALMNAHTELAKSFL